MVTSAGNAGTGYSADPAHLDLPRPADGARTAHRPWCGECKRPHDASELDTEGHCAKCARAIASRAAAAERRRQAEDVPTITPKAERDDLLASGAPLPAVPTPRPAPPRAPLTARSAAVLPAVEDTLVQVPLTELTPDPGNVREHLGDLTDLAASMATAGLLQPIVARRARGLLLVVAGHRRLAAARTLGWPTISTIVRDGMTHAHVLAAMLIENTQRTDLDPIEEAHALAAIRATDALTVSALGQLVGRSHSYVTTRLALLDLTTETQARVRAGTLSLAQAAAAHRKAIGPPPRRSALGSGHLTGHHALAAIVTDLCQGRGHDKHTPGRVGGIACGRCWEDAIRSDERARLSKTTTEES